MLRARHMVAAATLTEAEVFCQCAVCLRKMQYKCGISYVIEVEDMSVLTVCNFKTPSETGPTCPFASSTCVLTSSYIPCSVQSQRTHHMMKIHSIEFCAVLGMVQLGFKAVANHCVGYMSGSAKTQTIQSGGHCVVYS